MFKLALVTVSILACAYARPQTAAPPAAPAAHAASAAGAAASPNITLLKNDRAPLDDKGTYSYDIQLSDGTKFAQMGNTEAPGAGENETTIVIKGSYSYISPDGTPVNIMYIANKDGFQPTGDVIPKAGSPPAVGAKAPAGPAGPATPLAASAPAALAAPVAPVAPAAPALAAPSTAVVAAAVAA